MIRAMDLYSRFLEVSVHQPLPFAFIATLSNATGGMCGLDGRISGRAYFNSFSIPWLFPSALVSCPVLEQFMLIMHQGEVNSLISHTRYSLLLYIWHCVVTILPKRPNILSFEGEKRY